MDFLIPMEHCRGRICVDCEVRVSRERWSCKNQPSRGNFTNLVTGANTKEPLIGSHDPIISSHEPLTKSLDPPQNSP